MEFPLVLAQCRCQTSEVRLLTCKLTGREMNRPIALADLESMIIIAKGDFVSRRCHVVVPNGQSASKTYGMPGRS